MTCKHNGSVEMGEEVCFEFFAMPTSTTGSGHVYGLCPGHVLSARDYPSIRCRCRSSTETVVHATVLLMQLSSLCALMHMQHAECMTLYVLYMPGNFTF